MIQEWKGRDKVLEPIPSASSPVAVDIPVVEGSSIEAEAEANGEGGDGGGDGDGRGRGGGDGDGLCGSLESLSRLVCAEYPPGSVKLLLDRTRAR